MDTGGDRHVLFEAARARVGWTVQRLWHGYLALGGHQGAFEVEAYLAGLATLDREQQGVLAVALNEQLEELYLGARVPYLFVPDGDAHPSSDALVLVRELFHQQRESH